jgi:hypothetical protein
MVFAVLFLTVFSAPPAFAIEPPAIDPTALPPDETGPDTPTELRRVCSAPIIRPGANIEDGLLRLGADTVAARVNEALQNAGATASESMEADRERIDSAVAEITSELNDTNY